MFHLALTFGCLFAVATLVVYQWRTLALRGLALNRLNESSAPSTRVDRQEPAGSGPLRRTLRFVPYLLGVLIAIVSWLVLGLSPTLSVAFGLIVAMLGAECESYFATARAAKIERQLADAIDLMIGALGAGTGVTNAMSAAIEETSQPLKGQLEDLLGRIRLGDDPQAVFRSLAQRIPLETFLLFSSTLAVHWEVGGSLAPTLASVGRTIRDRIEIGRRIQSNIAQSQISTVFILLLTYFIAAVVWRNSPGQMQAFIGTEIGSTIVAGSMVLQAVGIIWMSAISKAKF
ncbi:Bacterial type II secretion system protein F domain protein [Anatilimnocola aggregata]|uniref:Bacterial type II secretion system protein F domain protein n=1 Tax=Anatilimnocola aggregata TaxID=2528021 RepID=A0A517Y9Z1_9BACT|nr:type II secretion system F family protein [Anatilimnocola aggregata]QDU27034.1 Bacterial type II secretion system protein F domain protein [Anatilimnocola aggregata]